MLLLITGVVVAHPVSVVAASRNFGTAAEGSGGVVGRLRSLNWADDTGAISIGRDKFGFPDVQALRGADPESVLDAIPDNWLVESPSSGSGIKFVNPDRLAR